MAKRDKSKIKKAMLRAELEVGDRPKNKKQKKLTDAQKGKVFDRLNDSFKKRHKKLVEDGKAGFSTVTGENFDIGLDLNHLMVACKARTNDPCGFDHKAKPWSTLEWGGATGGELGEAQNIAKKLLRLRNGTRGNKKKDHDQKKLVKKLGRELADTVCYIAAWAGVEGIDLSAEVVRTFNRKSDEIGYDFKL